MTAPIRLVIIDDDPRMRLLLRAHAARDRRVTVVGEADNGQEGIRVVTDRRPNAILLDVSMPVMDGLESIPALREVAPDARIIVLSSDPARHDEAVDAGADGFHDKWDEFENVFATIVRLVDQTSN